MTIDSIPDLGPGVSWLPSEWVHPVRVAVTDHHHLRPLGPADVDLELTAVQSSRERLWAAYGPAWGWPRAGLTREQELADLTHHAAETNAHESFLYGLLDADESEVLGCVYVDPAAKVGADAEISWWVVDRLVGSTIEAAVDAFVPLWIAEHWPFEAPRFPGRDLSWSAWLALPDLTIAEIAEIAADPTEGRR